MTDGQKLPPEKSRTLLAWLWRRYLSKHLGLLGLSMLAQRIRRVLRLVGILVVL